MKIILNNDVLDGLDMVKPSIQYPTPYQTYFILESGVEHYRLLRHLASKIPTDIIEIGTHAGTSAIAMCLDTSHNILTYDIVEEKVGNYSELSNIIFRITDYQSDEDYKHSFKESKMVFIDAPHNGDFEKDCFAWLKGQGFQGISVWDDIHLNTPMKDFWAQVDLPKLDVTKYGHITGTGIIFHSDEIEIELL